MKVNLSPQVRPGTLEVVRFGDVVVVNGTEFDFSAMGDGDTLPAGAVLSEWFVGPVDRVGAELELTLLLPLPPNYSAEQAFPMPIITLVNGLVPLPRALSQEVSE